MKQYGLTLQPVSICVDMKQCRHSPCLLFLQLGAEQQVSEQEDVTELPGALHQLHHEAIPQQLTVLRAGNSESP